MKGDPQACPFPSYQSNQTQLFIGFALSVRKIYYNLSWKSKLGEVGNKQWLKKSLQKLHRNLCHGSHRELRQPHL